MDDRSPGQFEAGEDQDDVALDALTRAEQAADLAEARLREAVEAMPHGVVFLDAEGRYILWNKQYAETYHRSADLFHVGARGHFHAERRVNVVALVHGRIEQVDPDRKSTRLNSSHSS